MAQIVIGARAPKSLAASSRFFPFFATVVIVQGVHVIEHIIQLFQVYVFDVPDEDALGLLGYIIQFNGTEEWLHLGFNFTYLICLYVLVVALREYVDLGVIPPWSYLTFAIAGAGVESWHMVEHVVIISNVIRHSGCPCPGIGDQALSVSDTILHFFYNAIAYTATVIPFWFLMKTRTSTGRARSGR
ncbi:MAG: hypothetical protein ABI658_13975 [Acidimicrobiales bacterium]